MQGTRSLTTLPCEPGLTGTERLTRTHGELGQADLSESVRIIRGSLRMWKCSALVIALLLAPLGCAAPGIPARGLSQPSSVAAEDVDPSRAYLALQQIQPKPKAPAHPDTLQPLNERAQRQIAKARRLVDEERFTEAAIELERALRYDPDHPTIHLTLATLHWKAGNFERVKTHIARSLEGNADQAVAHYFAGRGAIRDGEPAAAIAALRTALLCSDFNDDAEMASLIHVHLAEQLAAQGYLKAALSEYVAFEQTARGVQASEARPELAAWLGSDGARVAEAKTTLYEKLGQFSEAADALAPLVADATGDTARRRRYAQLLMKAERLKDALAAAQTLPFGNTETIELLFEIHRRLGDPTGIVDELKKHRQQAPDDPELTIALANVLKKLGKAAEARDELRQFMDRHPDAHAVRMRLVDSLIDDAQWEDAVRECAEGARQTPAQTAEFELRIVGLASNAEAVRSLLRPAAPDAPPLEAYFRGGLAVAAGQTEAAERYLRRSCSGDPEFKLARVALARLYLSTYDYTGALEVAARRKQDQPDDARLEYILGAVYERLDNIDNAELHLKAAVQLDRADAQAMLALAKLYQRSGRRLQAQRQLQVLLDRNPNHEAARELLAYSYIDDGKRDVAIQVFEDLARKASTPIVKARCQAILDQARRQTPDIEAYRTALLKAVEEHGGDATTWLAIAESYREPQSGYQGLGTDLPKLREAYRSALAYDPDNDQAAIGLVHTSQRLLEFEAAARQFENLLKRRPNRHAWRLGLSNQRSGLIDYYWWTQDYDAALTLAQTALARNDLDDVWRLRYRVAVIETLRQSRQDAEALKLLRRWAEPELKSTFWHGVFRSTISGTLGTLVQGESATARTFQRWSEALRIEQAPWSQILADEYIRQGKAGQAVAIWEALHLSAIDDLRVTLSLIETLRVAGQYTRASQHILDWLANDPENDDVIDLLVGLLAEARQTEDALELSRNRLLHTFDRERFQNRIIAVLAQAERFDDCVDYIESLIDEAIGVLTADHEGEPAPSKEKSSPEVLLRLPNEPFTMEGLHGRLIGLRQRLATVLIAAKDYRTAEAQLNDWLESTRNPDDRFAYLRRLAACSLFQGKGAEAAEAQARALLLRPDDISLNNDVAYAWIDRGVRMEEAERMIRYALSSNPTQTAYLDTYGWLLYKKGQFAEAKKWMLRAFGAVAEPDPVILDHLGDCSWRLGERDDAVERWKAAVAALGQRPEDELQTEDRRRVRDVTPEKTKAATEGKDPPVAPLATDVPSDDQSGDKEPRDR